ncbi:MAG: SUMF1/EgtB/PvdO family nonheme iron enzyme [Desulfobacterales bacterium]|nr:SUMF1/EgtB/PvdO family nonheme iron enzyme [Desulfobacterales bacterium]
MGQDPTIWINKVEKETVQIKVTHEETCENVITPKERNSCFAKARKNAEEKAVKQALKNFSEALNEDIKNNLNLTEDEIRSHLTGIKLDIINPTSQKIQLAKGIHYIYEARFKIQGRVSDELEDKLLSYTPEKCTVEDIQKALNRLDFYCEKLDGTFGPKTREALAKFQRSKNIPSTGKINTETCSALKDVHAASSVDYDYLEPITGMKYVYIPCGVFSITSPANPEITRNIHTDGFYMGKYEVTNAQFMMFKDDHYTKVHEFYSSEKYNHPVINVSWNDAVKFSEWLSHKTGKKFRLPTEAEWEYAALAKKKTSVFWENDTDACKYANVANRNAEDCDDKFQYTAPIGSFEPNASGLCDMLGNVWEWVAEESQSYNSTEPLLSLRIQRGGSYNDRPKYINIACKNKAMADAGDIYTGFRLVREK